MVRKYDKRRFCNYLYVHIQYKNGNIRALFFCRPKIFQRLLRIYEHIYLSIYLSMALQPFVGPWTLFQFVNHIHSR
jgi:hypothetical protein